MFFLLLLCYIVMSCINLWWWKRILTVSWIFKYLDIWSLKSFTYWWQDRNMRVEVKISFLEISTQFSTLLLVFWQLPILVVPWKYGFHLDIVKFWPRISGANVPSFLAAIKNKPFGKRSTKLDLFRFNEFDVQWTFNF